MDDTARLMHTLSQSTPYARILPLSTTGRIDIATSSNSGNTLEPLSQTAHNDANKVRGCVSQVWLECEPKTNAEGERTLHYRGDSDSHLVRGLIAIAIALFSDRTPIRSSPWMRSPLFVRSALSSI